MPTVRVLGGARPRRLARLLQRLHGRRRAEGALAALARGRGLVQGPRGDPDGRQARRRRVLVRGLGRAASSRAAGTSNAAPRWLEQWNARRLPDSYAGPRLGTAAARPRTLRAASPGADAVKGEWDGKDTVFPHAIRGLPPAVDYYDDLRRTPFADEILLDFALAAMKRHDLGEDDATDILAVELLGLRRDRPHVRARQPGADGPDAAARPHARPALRRGGPPRRARAAWLAVLTADHGVMPLVEVLQAQRPAGATRDAARSWTSRCSRRLARALPRARRTCSRTPTRWSTCSTSRRSRARASSALEVEQTIREALLGTGPRRRRLHAAQLMGPPPADDPFFDLHQRAFFAPRSGDLIARIKPLRLPRAAGSAAPATARRTTTTATCRSCSWARASRRGGATCRAGPEDIAWTLGRLLGLDVPAAGRR